MIGNGHSKGSAVATEFGYDRRTLSRQGLGCATTYGVMCDTDWPQEEVPMSRHDILGRD